MDKISKKLILKLVKNNVEDLNTFKEVRYAINSNDFVTRDSFEIIKINNFLAASNFTQEMKLFYLSKLKKRIKKDMVEIYDNYPTSAPDVTGEFLKKVDNLIAIMKLDNLQNDLEPFIFFEQRNYYRYFIIYIEKFIIEPYIDFSYLFQRMLYEGFIKKITHKQFIDWLEENKLISESVINKLRDEGQFRSLKKSYSTQRENNFNTVFQLK